jgi:Fe-S cluster assembly protein SufD
MAEAAVQTTPTEDRIAGLSMPQSGWTIPARQAALARLRSMGVPQRRDEYWKFTRPDTLIAPAAPEAALFDPQETPLFSDRERLGHRPFGASGGHPLGV